MGSIGWSVSSGQFAWDDLGEGGGLGLARLASSRPDLGQIGWARPVPSGPDHSPGSGRPQQYFVVEPLELRPVCESMEWLLLRAPLVLVPIKHCQAQFSVLEQN